MGNLPSGLSHGHHGLEYSRCHSSVGRTGGWSSNFHFSASVPLASAEVGGPGPWPDAASTLLPRVHPVSLRPRNSESLPVMLTALARGCLQVPVATFNAALGVSHGHPSPMPVDRQSHKQDRDERDQNLQSDPTPASVAACVRARKRLMLGLGLQLRSTGSGSANMPAKKNSSGMRCEADITGTSCRTWSSSRADHDALVVRVDFILGASSTCTRAQ